MRGVAVVTAEEMKRVESAAFAAGESDEAYMKTAGEGIASLLEEVLVTPRSSGTVHLLIGKGNNGGDAFVAGEILLKAGYTVVAYHMAPLEECSPLCQKMGKKFSGKRVLINKAPLFEEGFIVDGLFGTGFKGAVEGLARETIEAANRSSLLIFAIDIPSGLNGNTGDVETVAIKAKATFYLGLPKLGFFLKDGWNHVGELIGVDFGMPAKYYEAAEEAAFLIDDQKAAKALPKMERSRHKYQAGYVLAIAGSPGMAGAAMMASFATLKAGAGIVRLFYPEEMKEELATSPYELIKEGWDLKDDTRIFEEAKRAKAMIVGPGIGRSGETEAAVKTLLAKTTLPTVIDADGLFILAQNKGMSLPETTILTPHYQEMKRIIEMEPTLEVCQDFVKERGVTLVLKGAPTIIFHPHTKPLIVPHGDPGMATAGTGDILTGIIGALLAQGLRDRDAAALGVLLHALAGEIAAEDETPYAVTATSLIDYLPDALQSLVDL